MKIPKSTLNGAIEYCIDQYVRLYRDRNILREKWFHGLSFNEIANKYHLSEESIKKIVYGIGDEILLRATAMKELPK